MPTNSQTDVVTILEQDHRTVEQLFTQIEQGGGDPQSLAQQLITELTIHAEVEEQLVYPAVRTEVDEGHQLVDEAEQEHAEVKQLLAELEIADPGDARFVEIITQLRTSVQHHVEEEESEMLPQLREQASGALAELGAQVLAFKEQRQQEFGGLIDDSPAIDLTDAGLAEMTKDELYAIAQEREIDGRSSMTKDELIAALQQ